MCKRPLGQMSLDGDAGSLEDEGIRINMFGQLHKRRKGNDESSHSSECPWPGGENGGAHPKR
ncbi:MAG TPA: hypothetical protein DDY39_07845 [Nitrospira sp.]|nr:hypothetical protein [Nitrospira sp.]